jgi:hypothetical protein
VNVHGDVPVSVTVKFALDPEQIVVVPVREAVEVCTVTEDVVLLQVVTASVKVNVMFPVATPVTRPALVTVAINGLLLTHVPPLVGLKVIVLPTHKFVEGVLTVGSAITVTVMGDELLRQPVVLFVTVKVALYVAAGAAAGTVMTIGVAGNATFVMFAKPAPNAAALNVMLYLSGLPVVAL